MLRVLDVVGALTARRYSRSVTVQLAFTVAGDGLTDQDGDYLLSVHDGRATCWRAEEAEPEPRVLSPRGLALLYAGAQSSANLRSCGQLTGGNLAEDLEWDTLFGGRQRHVRNYF